MTVIKAKVAAALVALAVLGTGIAWAARGDADSPAPAPTPAPAALVAAAPNADPTDDADAGQREGERERPAAPAAPGLTGKVTEVAKDGKSFTVETPPTERGGEPGKATVKFAEKATVTFDGVGINGAKPTAGYQASVWLDGNSKDTAATVIFSAPDGLRRGLDLIGTVVEAAKDGKSVTVETRPQGRPERGADVPKVTIAFDDKTVLSFSNVGKDGAKIAPGQIASVWYADDVRVAGNMIAGKVQFYSRGDAARRDEKRPDLAGKVMRAAPDAKSFVVEVPPTARGEEPKRIIVKTDDKTTVAFHNVPLDGAKVAPGMQAQVWLADGSKVDAAKVHFTGTVPERWQTVSGKVVAVAKDGNSYTIEQPPTVRGEEAKRIEVKITAQTKLAFFGVGPGGAKIAEGMMAQARLADGSTDTATQVTFGLVTGRR